MKYIKTPVSHNEQGCIGDANGVALVSAYGRGFDVGAMNEIAEAINAYDALVAQRDALAGALTLVGVYLGLWPPEAKTMQARHCAELSEKITEALALVWEEAIDA